MATHRLPAEGLGFVRCLGRAVESRKCPSEIREDGQKKISKSCQPGKARNCVLGHYSRRKEKASLTNKTKASTDENNRLPVHKCKEQTFTHQFPLSWVPHLNPIL